MANLCLRSLKFGTIKDESLDKQSLQKLEKIFGPKDPNLEALKNSKRDTCIIHRLLGIINFPASIEDRCWIVEVLYDYLADHPRILRNYPRFYSAALNKLLKNFDYKEYDQTVVLLAQKIRLQLFGTLKHQCIRVLLKNGTKVEKIPSDLQWIAKGEQKNELFIISNASGDILRTNF